MTDELLDRVRAVDPLPEASHAPPFAAVYAGAPAASRGRGRRRARRPLAILLPGMSAAVVVGVIVAALTFVTPARHAHVPVRVRSEARGARRVPSVPAGGMPGSVVVAGAAMGAAGDGVISVEQCLGCGRDGGATRHARFTAYLLTTRDGGARWTRARRDYYLENPVLVGENGWATRSVLLTRAQAGHAAAYEPGVTESHYASTDDGGRSWAEAAGSPVVSPEASISLGGDETWVTSQFAETATVLHGAAGGTRLTPTTSQPVPHGDDDAHVVTGGAGVAYLFTTNPVGLFSTHSDGRHWQPLSRPPCAGRRAGLSLEAAFGQTVWLTCTAIGESPRLVRSLDGGRSWQQLPQSWGDAGPLQVIAASARVAWAVNSRQEVLRTTNAGVSWQRVWSATDARQAALSRPVTTGTATGLPILIAQSVDSASIVTLLNRGSAAGRTNLVVYRTTDAGRTWSTRPVALGRTSTAAR